MSNHSLKPELLPARRRRGLAAAALAASLGGVVGAAAVGLTAWHISSPTGRPAAITSDLGPAVLPSVNLEPIAAATEPASEVAELAAERAFEGHAAHVVFGAAPMVNLAADALPEWQSGTPSLVDSDDFARTLRREVTAAVPSRYRGRVGTRAHAVGDNGAVCEVTLGALAVIGKYYGEDDPPETRAQRIDAWDYTAPSLVAELEIPDSCGDIGWVILADDAPTTAITGDPRPLRVDPNSPMRDATVAAFRALPDWTKIQTEWAADGRSEPWDTYDSTYALISAAPKGNNDGFAIASAGITGCESVNGIVTAVWRTRDGALAEPIAVPAGVFLSKIIGAADLNGDGIPEIIFEGARQQTGVLVSRGGRYTLVEGPETQSHICPC
jgi:hypothetical protein